MTMTMKGWMGMKNIHKTLLIVQDLHYKVVVLYWSCVCQIILNFGSQVY